MNQQNEAQQAQIDQQPERSAQKALSRRKFLTQASVASLPVLMSLKSGDAWGCVPLNCTGGEGNWSGTASAVSSVKERATGNGSISPIFDSVSTILKVVKADLGLLVDGQYGYLWDHVRTLRYKKADGTYKLVYQDFKSSLSSLTGQDIQQWFTKCEGYSKQNNLFSNSSSSSRFNTVTTPLRKPMVYNGVVICANTKMSQFFGQMTSGKKLIDCLKNDITDEYKQDTAVFEKYVGAAFVGSLWQQDEIWDTYGNAPKSGHKSDCYPLIGELMQAYRNVIANAPARKITDIKAAGDMGRMFKAYTKL